MLFPILHELYGVETSGQCCNCAFRVELFKVKEKTVWLMAKLKERRFQLMTLVTEKLQHMAK